jgi:peptidoglycan/LPS O-acetylase OafA/YrhL
LLERRRDIDGVRAIAIALVVAYHAAPTLVPAGFVGVDVFFVLSGFLITRILLADALPGRVRRFYERRLRRLAPALILVLAVCLAAGWLLLLPEELRQLGRHALAATLFVANFVFFKETGYFDSEAFEKPLLHLWSLGIEEQFYLAWPLLVWALARRGQARWGTVLLALASLAGALGIARSAPDAGFYLPWFRFWELLAGALVAQLPRAGERSRAGREALALAAVAAVVASALMIDPRSAFPSWNALGPVVGTAVLLWTGGETWLARRCLASAPMVLVGLVSYPLYLWHWPLLSFHALLSDPTAWSRGAMVGLALLLSLATYFGVEKPAQRWYGHRPRHAVWALLAGMGAVAASSFWLASRVPPTLSRTVPHLDFLTAQRDLDFRLRRAIATQPCFTSGTQRETVASLCVATGPASSALSAVVWGDSTGASWGPLVQTWAAERQARTAVFSVSGCPPLLGIRSPLHAHCEFSDDVWKERLITELGPSLIVLTARWGAYVNEPPPGYRGLAHRMTAAEDEPPTLASSRDAIAVRLPATLERLTQIAPVIVVLAPPDLVRNPFAALPRQLEFRPTLGAHREAQRLVEEVVRKAAADNPRIAVLDPAETLCAGPRCEAILGEVLVYQDDNHVSAQGALLFREAFARAVRALGL